MPSTSGGTFDPNSFIECGSFFRLQRKTNYVNSCSLVAHFDTLNLPNDNSLSITFKAEEIKTDVNEDDNDDNNAYVVNVLTLTSIISLLILYYLLLLLYA